MYLWNCIEASKTGNGLIVICRGVSRSPETAGHVDECRNENQRVIDRGYTAVT
jgi:hypothetical protein